MSVTRLLLLLLWLPLYAFSAVLLPNQVAGFDIGSTVKGQFGFEHSGSQYLFLNQGGFSTPLGDVKVHAIKSANGGATWTEQDASNAPQLPYEVGIGTPYTIAVDGATVIVVSIRFHGSPAIVDGLVIINYNLNTDTWGSPVNYNNPKPGYMGRDQAFQSLQISIRLLVRGPSDYVLYYSGPQETSGITGFTLARVYYATFDGSTFGTPTILPDQAGSAFFYFPTSACVDAAGRSHFFYYDNNFNAIGSGVLSHVSLTSGGTFGTTQAVSTQVYLNREIGQFSDPIIYFSGATEEIGIAVYVNDDAGSTTQTERLYYAPTALNPTWSDSVISDDQAHLMDVEAFNLTAQAITLSYTSGTLVAVWTWDHGHMTGGVGEFWTANAPSNTLVWTTAAQAFVSESGYSAVQVISFPMTGGFGVAGFSNTQLTEAESGQFLFIAVTPPVAAMLIKVRVE